MLSDMVILFAKVGGLGGPWLTMDEEGLTDAIK